MKDGEERHSRTVALIGCEAMEKIKTAAAAVFGLGGVGSYAAEALARTGISRFLLLDSDTVTESNINRQLVALYSTAGRLKTDVMKERILDINPHAEITVAPVFYGKETVKDISLAGYDCVIDAIDNIMGKLLLAEECCRLNIPEVSCMGAGNKLDPSAFEAADIYETSVCPLARVMRRELKKRGISRLRVVYSREAPLSRRAEIAADKGQGRAVPASIAFVPAAAGLLLAAEAVRLIIGR